jgi:glycerol-3-phosphate dehydrogenase (NAD(P)+)
MAKVCIIGNGAWGRAISHVVRQNTNQVRIAGRGEKVEEEIIIIAVPTNNIRELTSVIQPNHKPRIVINTAKGIESETHKLPGEILKELLPHCSYFTLIGPGFAQEVIEETPTLVNIGYEKKSAALTEVRQLLQTDFFRVRPTRGTTILELSAAMKNIYAISCGIADGLGYRTNTRTLLLTVAIEEIRRLFFTLRLPISLESTAGTIGDLALTCNSLESRNFQFGRHLTTTSVKASLESVHGVVEGYTSLESLDYLEERSGISLPLASFIKTIVTNDKPLTVQKAFGAFILNI